MEISLLDFLSPDFLNETVVKINGLNSKGLITSNIDLKFYYLDGIRRDKVFIEPIWELAVKIFDNFMNDEDVFQGLKDSIDKNKLMNEIMKELDLKLPKYNSTIFKQINFYDMVKDIYLELVRDSEVFKNKYENDPLFERMNDLNKFMNFIKEEEDKNSEFYKESKDMFNLERLDDNLSDFVSAIEYDLEVMLKTFKSDNTDFEDIFDYVEILVENLKISNIKDMYFYAINAGEWVF